MQRSRESNRTGKGRVAAGVVLAALSAVAAIQVAGAAPGKQPITGTGKAERLVGTRGPDVIRGRGGDDTLVGRARGDSLYGGRGLDTLRGGRGSDGLYGGPEGALLVGGGGRDGFNMTSGSPVSGGGDDMIRARDGRPDEINCGRGDDVAYVDRVEDGVYDCERVVAPGARAGA
ncbi:MAG TPA: hypothetical protein VFH44_08335 [Solirubrobacterales bacterium]|nr:hypothetical protein [Solirubrobacterales bacterium]